jgi:hypothetical protein
MLNILARARHYQSLTPAERALLRLLEGLAAVALVGAATAAAQYLSSPTGAGLGAVTWPIVARVSAAGAAVAVLLALAKYFKAHSDPALADALGALATRIERTTLAPDTSSGTGPTTAPAPTPTNPSSPVAPTSRGHAGTPTLR